MAAFGGGWGKSLASSCTRGKSCSGDDTSSVIDTFLTSEGSVASFDKDDEAVWPDGTLPSWTVDDGLHSFCSCDRAILFGMMAGGIPTLAVELFCRSKSFDFGTCLATPALGADTDSDAEEVGRGPRREVDSDGETTVVSVGLTISTGSNDGGWTP